MKRHPGHASGWEVPEHRVHELRPRAARYCVCIFVINEGKRIDAQLERMRPYAEEADIIIADGGSTDGSLDDHARLKDLGVRAILVKTDKGRLSAQMRMAFSYAMREGYAGVISMDGNNKDDPAAIPLFLKALDEGYDHVQGSRFITGGKGVNTPLSRLIGIKLVHAPLISRSAGFRYTDTTNGFRAYSARLLDDARVAPFREVFMDYELHYYLAIRAARLGLRVKEVPVTRVYPPTGATPTKISPIKGNIAVLKTLIRACLGSFDPGRS
ncbi:MAG: glycosyltransferase family 2 protein [Deltaproteobacteria bacterium]|nr:glycosyltransferase family 2 protein [Deltaproteobacteria bacterium]